MVADTLDNADKFVTDGHRHRDGFLRPGVPVVDVHVGAADRRLQHPDQHVIVANFRNRHVLQPKTRLAFGLHNAPSSFSARKKLGESGKQESRKVRE